MSLSDKEKVLDYTGIDGINGVLVYYPKENVREFIAKMLEEAKLHTNPTCKDGVTWTEFIEKEAGPKLVGEEEINGPMGWGDDK